MGELEWPEKALFELGFEERGGGRGECISGKLKEYGLTYRGGVIYHMW